MSCGPPPGRASGQKEKPRKFVQLVGLSYGCPGGERGIRTPDRLLTYTRFPGVRLKPLIHLSGKSAIIAESFRVSRGGGEAGNRGRRCIGQTASSVAGVVACIYNDCRGSAFTTSPWRSKHAATQACGFTDVADAHWLHVAPGESSAAARARTAAYVARSGRRATGRRTGPGAHHRGDRGVACTCVAIGIGVDGPRGSAHRRAPKPAGSASRFAILAIVHYHAA